MAYTTSHDHLILEGEGYIWREGSSVKNLHFTGIGPCTALVIRGYQGKALALTVAIHFDSPKLVGQTVEAVLKILDEARDRGEITSLRADLIGGYNKHGSQFDGQASDCIFEPIEALLRLKGIHFVAEGRRPVMEAMTGEQSFITVKLDTERDVIATQTFRESEVINNLERRRAYNASQFFFKSIPVLEERKDAHKARMSRNPAQEALAYDIWEGDRIVLKIKAPGCLDYIKLAFQSICCCGSRTPTPAPHMD